MNSKSKKRLLPSLFCAFIFFITPLGAAACGEVDPVDNLEGVIITQTSTVPYDYSILSEYKEFKNIAKSEYLVPGLSEGLVPQGMDVWEEKNLVFISGYFEDVSNTSGSPSSMIVAVDLATGELAGKYCIKNVDGSHHTSHVGGVAVTEKNIFISNSSKLYRIPLSQIDRLGKSGTLEIVEAIKVPARASFCNYSNGVLWVGDFQDGEAHKTPEWRHMTNNDGKLYKAWSVGYEVRDTESEFSGENWDSATMEYATPDYVLSIEDMVQGFTFVGDQIVLSQSPSTNNNSKIRVYNNVLKNHLDTNVTLNGKSVPVWFLDRGVHKKTYTILSMSEGITYFNDKLWVLFETGTKKYRNAKRPTDHVWSMALPK